MSISGFTIARNADKYYFPIKESIESILPIVDEFIIALAPGDADDKTEALIKSINSNKIRIIYRDSWDEKLFKDAAILRQETTFALNQCKSDWCFYLQADEIVHEDDLHMIQKLCNQYINDKEVEGFLFRYYHFYGDYNHYAQGHKWYPYEIRIVRNRINIESYKDAQSFRIQPLNRKLQVVKTKARIFHYGWVRPPHIMKSKQKEQHSLHHGKNIDNNSNKIIFRYGPLKYLHNFNNSHPQVMQQKIKEHNWKHLLDQDSKLPMSALSGYIKRKDRILSYIENNWLAGKQIFGWRNWKILSRKK